MLSSIVLRWLVTVNHYILSSSKYENMKCVSVQNH